MKARETVKAVRAELEAARKPAPVKGPPMWLGVVRPAFRLTVKLSTAQRKLDDAMSQTGRAGRLLMTRSGRMIIRAEQLDIFSR